MSCLVDRTTVGTGGWDWLRASLAQHETVALIEIVRTKVVVVHKSVELVVEPVVVPVGVPLAVLGVGLAVEPVALVVVVMMFGA